MLNFRFGFKIDTLYFLTLETQRMAKLVINNCVSKEDKWNCHIGKVLDIF